MASEPRDTSIAHVTFAPFRLAWRTALALLLLWLVSIAVHIAYVRWHHLDPREHMEKLMSYYVDQTHEHAMPQRVALSVYDFVFEKLQAQRLGQAHDEAQVSAGLKRSIWSTFKTDLTVAAYATVLFAVKAAIAITAAVFFVLVIAVAAVDGLVQRYIRTACGGHESASLYHRAKRYGLRLVPAFAASVFFCSPVAFNPAWLFVPVAVASAVLLRLQVTYYKKYL